MMKIDNFAIVDTVDFGYLILFHQAWYQIPLPLRVMDTDKYQGGVKIYGYLRIDSSRILLAAMEAEQ